jgi:regulator of sigma E protease
VLEKVLIFFIFLGPLVFFHELGHFFFARLFGVRVEVFSIGFGPKIFSFKKGDTQYAISLIPLGGYVKMFGDDPLSEKELTAEEEKVAYTKKGKWARFWIVFGGPLANFILAFFIYFALVSVGEKVPQTKFGVIPQESILYKAGIRTGDVLKQINQQEIVSFDDLNMIDTDVKAIEVQRQDKTIRVPIEMKGMEFITKFSEVSGPLRAPLLVNSEGKMFFVKELNSKSSSLEEILKSDSSQLELIDISKEEVSLQFNPESLNLDSKSSQVISRQEQSWEEAFKEAKLYPKDLLIKNIQASSPAAEANFQAGSIIVGIEGRRIFSFNELKSTIQNLGEEKPITLTLLNTKGTETTSKITPRYREHNGQKFLSVGVESGISFYSIMIETQSKGVLSSISKAYYRTLDGTVKTFLGFKKLITGEVALKNVGGPIAIGQVASESFNISLSMFFRLMALISINLGLINLFPIPVLDGGHIVFILLEAINRGPLSRKKLMYAQQVGMSLLFLLIFVALYNDISRLF